MTPNEFCEKMKTLEDPEDPERMHAAMDKLMCKLLRSLGYASGVKVFTKAKKWHS